MEWKPKHYKTGELKGHLKFASDNWEQRLQPIIRHIEMHNLLNISDKVTIVTLLFTKKQFTLIILLIYSWIENLLRAKADFSVNPEMKE